MAGDGAGVLHIMDLPRSLRRRVPSEVNTMQAFLMRQLARLDYLQACKPRRAQLLKVTTPMPVCKTVLSGQQQYTHIVLWHQPSLLIVAFGHHIPQPLRVVLRAGTDKLLPRCLEAHHIRVFDTQQYRDAYTIRA